MNKNSGKYTIRVFIILIGFLVIFTGFYTFADAEAPAASSAEKPDCIFQTSILQALLHRIYDGNMTMDQLKKYGDLGLGTFNAFDGEMIVLDGHIYKVKASDGLAYEVPSTEKTPFAVVTHFTADATFTMEKEMTFQELQLELDNRLPHPGFFYAFKIEGRFKHVKVRSVFPQKKPYPELQEIFKTQTFFEFNDVEGVLVGFRYPAFARCFNSPGYHLHFITKDRKKGGHVLDCITSPQKLLAEVDYIHDIQLHVPSAKQ